MSGNTETISGPIVVALSLTARAEKNRSPAVHGKFPGWAVVKLGVHEIGREPMTDREWGNQWLGLQEAAARFFRQRL